VFCTEACRDRGRRRIERGPRDRFRGAGISSIATGGARDSKMALPSLYSSENISQHVPQSHACVTEWLFASASPGTGLRRNRKSVPSRTLPKEAVQSGFAHWGNMNSSDKTC
jgi:hypothetical protein